MAFLLDADHTSPTFNCYVSVSDADDYFAGRFGAEKWLEFDDAPKQALLMTATRTVDTLRFGGQRTVLSQPMQWPRSFIVDHDGYAVDAHSIPQKFKDAVCEIAFWMWTEEDRFFSDTDLGQIKSYDLPGVKVTAAANAERFPQAASQLLESIGPGAVQVPSSRARGGRISL